MNDESTTHTYKVGDRVLMGPVKWQESRLKNTAPYAPCKVLTIDGISADNDGKYYCGCGWFHESQILGYAFEYGDEIVVWDSNGVVNIDKFYGYWMKPTGLLVMGVDCSWKHARPIQPTPVTHPAKQKLINTIQKALDEFKGQPCGS